MNARRLVIAAVLGAVAISALATAQSGSTQARPSPKKPVGKKIAAAPAHRRVLCICIVRTTSSSGVSTPFSREEFERQYDADMVAHSLEPVYGSVSPAVGVTA